MEGAPGFSKACWFDVKHDLGFDFPNLPYFIHGDLKMSESMAIHKYIADKWDKKLLGSTPEHRATINMLAGILAGIKLQVTMPTYNGEKD